MSDKRYDLIFEGKIVKGQDPAKVKRNLMALLKTDEKGVKRLFSGKAVVIKKNMDQQKAMAYKQTLNKAGALCRIAEAGAAAAPPSPPPSPKADRPLKTKEAEPPPSTSEDDDLPEMIHCPKCNYRQKPSDRCIMCGQAITEIIEAEGAPAPAGASSSPIPLKPLAPGEILLTNIESVPGSAIVEHFGLVSGNTIRAKNMFRDIMASLKNLIGGELKGYTQLLQESREQALERMKEQAREMGANAVINVRFSTSSVTQGASELYSYGTAVRVE